MSNRIVPVTGWLLSKAPVIVSLLGRNAVGNYEINGDNRTGAGAFELVIQEGIEVYRVTRKFTEVKMEDELFFTHEQGKTGNPAYFSLVNNAHVALDRDRRITLLACPWYSWNDSSKLFDRLQNTCGRVLFKGVENMQTIHPFSLARNKIWRQIDYSG